jgi:hypothetical protein
MFDGEGTKSSVFTSDFEVGSVMMCIFVAP